MPMPALSDAQMDLLPLYSTCVTEMGVGGRDYQQTQLWHSSVVGAYSASASVRSDKDSIETAARQYQLLSQRSGTQSAGNDRTDAGIPAGNRL